MENPYELRESGPYSARPRSPQRRGADYVLPPMGNGHTVDTKHFWREAWTGRLMMLLFLGLPAVYVIGIEFDVW